MLVTEEGEQPNDPAPKDSAKQQAAQLLEQYLAIKPQARQPASVLQSGSAAVTAPRPQKKIATNQTVRRPDRRTSSAPNCTNSCKGLPWGTGFRSRSTWPICPRAGRTDLQPPAGTAQSAGTTGDLAPRRNSALGRRLAQGADSAATGRARRAAQEFAAVPGCSRRICCRVSRPAPIDWAAANPSGGWPPRGYC